MYTNTFVFKDFLARFFFLQLLLKKTKKNPAILKYSKIEQTYPPSANMEILIGQPGFKS